MRLKFSLLSPHAHTPQETESLAPGFGDPKGTCILMSTSVSPFIAFLSGTVFSFLQQLPTLILALSQWQVAFHQHCLIKLNNYLFGFRQIFLLICFLCNKTSRRGTNAVFKDEILKVLKLRQWIKTKLFQSFVCVW